MRNADVNRCIEFLNKKPGLFFQRENVAEKLRCIDVIQQEGAPRLVYSLIGSLRSNHTLIQTKAAEAILSLLARLKSLRDYTESLKNLSIGKEDIDFYRANFDERIYVQLLGMASVNGNGYVREKAVRELASLQDAEGIKFILLRLGDWVPVVRNTASEAIFLFLKDAFLSDLLRQLPTIDWLLKVERVDLSNIHSRIIQFVAGKHFTGELYNTVKQLDDGSRLRYYQIFLSHSTPTRDQIDKIAIDRNFLIRLELVKHLGKFDVSFQEDLLGRFLQDRSAVIRLWALYASKRFTPIFDDRITLLLSDQAASVRDLSRRLLKNKGIDFAQLYRQRVSDQYLPTGSLPGLAETGGEDDLPVFEQNILSTSNDLVVVSLEAIRKCDPGKARDYSLKLLTHPCKKVRDKAVDVLVLFINAAALEKIRTIYSQGDYEVKKTILSLFGRMGGWYVIGDLLLALTDEALPVQETGWQLVEKWKLKAINLFTTPSKAEVERAIQIYKSLDVSKLNFTPARRTLFTELEFFLS